MSTSSVAQRSRFVPRVGAIVAGKYRIERKLGEGGMGFVVAAHHLTLGGQVALKFLTPGDELRETAVTRFTREAQSVARIKNEHVARVLDMGTTESGDPFIVMELLEGTDLHKFVRKNGPLPIADAVEYVLQAAEGVAEAHAMGIVHRDLKPANLFLTHKADGTPFVRVLDFGIAKNIRANKEAGDVSLTVDSDVLGSPLYMSPEQIRNPKEVDPRTDVWSLGAILYKLLTGRAAFEADNPSASLAMIVVEDPTPLRQLRPDAPYELEAVIRRCLEKSLERRFQTVDEFACALLPFAPVRPRGRPWVPTTISATNLAPMGAETNVAPIAAVLPGPTSNTRPRSISTIAVVVGGLAAVGVLLVVAFIIGNTSSAHETKAPHETLPSALQSAQSAPIESVAKKEIAPVEIAAPIATTSASAIALPTASTTPTTTTKRTTRNNALDDRL